MKDTTYVNHEFNNDKNKVFNNCKFIGCRFVGTIENCDFFDCEFDDDCDTEYAHWSNCRIDGKQFNN